MSVTVLQNLLSPFEIQTLLNDDDVIKNKEKLNQENVVKFLIELSETMKTKLSIGLGIDLSKINHIPMRWVKGDTETHKDFSPSEFENTYLIYLTKSIGDLIIDNESYLMNAGSGYIFSKGIEHSTVNTANTERLMLGPMSESGFSVGAPPPTLTTLTPTSGPLEGGNSLTISILNTDYYLGNPADFPVTLQLGENIYVFNYTIAEDRLSIEIPSLPAVTQEGVYDLFISINDGGEYLPYSNSLQYTYGSSPPIPCFKEDTKILTDQGYKLIQDLRKGDLVKTLLHDFLPIDMIGKREMHHPASQHRIKDQLYQCSKDQFGDKVFEPLILTGGHSILIDDFISKEQREKVIEVNGDTYVTDRKYRLPACADPRASVYEHPGTYTIYHVALENCDYYMNYGIYANGLLVESCSKRYLKELSNMILIE
jgi:hypothetical protein